MGQVAACDCCGGADKVVRVPLLAGESTPRPQAYSPAVSARNELGRVAVIREGQVAPPLTPPRSAEYGLAKEATAAGASKAPTTASTSPAVSQGLTGLEWARRYGGSTGDEGGENWAYAVAMELQSQPSRLRPEEISAQQLAQELHSKPLRLEAGVQQQANHAGSMVVEVGQSRRWDEDPFEEEARCAFEDGPGYYITTHVGVVVRSRIGLDSEKITKLDEGANIRVLEVALLEQEGRSRVRARIEMPAGWITLVSNENGQRWATKQPKAQSQLAGAGDQPGCCLFAKRRRTLGPKVQQKINELFMRLDHDGSGEITRKEAMQFFKTGFGNISANAMFNEVDTNVSDTITRDEFLNFWEQVRQSGYTEQDLSDELDVIMEGGAWVDWKDQRRTEPLTAKKN
mmetsp:Transcript_14930/g.38354  ORF Transcript_14930/g.38354 Transcript_14930/m.38354 type:complete len:401 (-) Transcript_14930:284-1486(-)